MTHSCPCLLPNYSRCALLAFPHNCFFRSQSPLANVYARARQEHAFLLRCERATYQQIGDRLGVSHVMAMHLISQFAKRLARATRKTRLYWEK